MISVWMLSRNPLWGSYKGGFQNQDLTTLNYQYYGSGQLLCEVERHLTQSPLIQPLLGGEGEGDVGENDLLTGSRVHSHSQGCQ